MKNALTTLALLCCGLMSFNAQADNYKDGEEAALNFSRGTISDFTQFQMAGRTQVALNALIAEANEALAEKGFTSEAEVYQSDWDASFSTYFTQVSLFDLGDHKPLSEWLSKFYTNLQDKLGGPVMHLLHFDDLFVLNYGIPVVFQPSGNANGDHWNKLEYQRHFVPFATVVTYWGSYLGCKVAATHLLPLHRWCGAISMILRGAMQNMVAPKMSDFIYSILGNKPEALDLDYAAIEVDVRSQINLVQK